MGTIPKIIHYCWVGGNEKPESVKYCIESWKKFCPDYKIIEWNESNYDFSKNEYMKQAYEAKKWGFVPDYARLDIIYEYGGIYLDTDVELIKNLDDILDCNSFFGFEDTGEGDFFVACGLGFGAEAHNELIKKLRDYYDSVNFINTDGSLNLMPAPRHNAAVFKEYGVLMDNSLQDYQGNIFFPSDYFCPKVFKTGKTKITEHTYSIHHFSASWMDEKIRKEIEHNQKVCSRYGDRLGHLILVMESVWKKYGLLGSVKKFLVRIYEELLSYKSLLGSILKKKFFRQKQSDEIVLFDTALFTENCGDQIIMDNCVLQLNSFLDVDHARHISTHKLPDVNENINGKIKILCGTNILSCTMRQYGLWKLPKDLSKFSNIILMGVGFDSYNNKSDLYTRLLFKHMLSKNYYHSVRDSFSEECLKKMGIKNVLNTGCPTMWKLTKEHCSTIPHEKSSNVICTITDYSKDPDSDRAMLDILLENYNKVYLWLQGKFDLEYLKELGYDTRVNLIPSSLNEYDAVLSQTDLDYVGTRLHAGIRALSFSHRAIIISIDNRAECISKDTGLTTIKRKDIPMCLKDKIFQNFETEIDMPWENIKLWKEQFNKENF